jgi:hypothetical protein
VKQSAAHLVTHGHCQEDKHLGRPLRVAVLESRIEQFPVEAPPLIVALRLKPLEHVQTHARAHSHGNDVVISERKEPEERGET